MICRVSPLPPTLKVGGDHIGNEDGDDDDDNDRGDDNNDDGDDDITSSPSFLHSLVKEEASEG